MTDGLTGVEVERIVSEEGGFETGNVERVNAMAEGKTGRETVVQAFLGFDSAITVERKVDAVGEGFKKAFFINHTGLKDGGDEGLTAFHGIVKGNAKTGRVRATGFGG